MRVFHGPNNISGSAGVLAAAQRSLGVDAESVCFGTGSFGYAVDRQLPYGARSRLSLLSMAPDFDVFHFYFGESLAGSRLSDVAVLKRLGKKVFFYFCGCDLRDSKVVVQRHEISACAECWPMACSANRDRAAEVAASCDGVFVSTPDLLEFMPQAVLLPQPLDLAKFARLRELGTNAEGERTGPLRVAHAPSSRTIKGTKYVEAAIAQLREAGHQIELVLVEGRSYDESLAIYQTCDIGLDQVLIGAYGQFAVEMMAMGKPVLCFLRDDVVDLYPEVPPIIRVTPSTLADVIAGLLADRAGLAAQGARGVDYVERVHGADRVAARAVECYRQAARR
jgi:hypothetical protein